MNDTTSQGLVMPASPYLAGFDTDTPLTAAAAQAYFERGYRFCLRYISLGAEQAGDLSSQELAAILASGLAFMPVQHVERVGWQPSAALGSVRGQAAAGDAQAVGLPAGVNLWLDLEGVADGTAATDVSQYCQSWFAAVAQAGYLPGLYVGGNCGLSGTQLYELPFQHYWHSASIVPALPQRGYQMSQKLVDNLIDADIVFSDQFGGTPVWLARQAPSYPVLREQLTPSDAVCGLQMALNAQGASPSLALDGYFGPATDAAVRSFQQRRGLQVDGVAGPSTWSALTAAG